MAQLVCDECGRVVDFNASRCPYCGCPVEMKLHDSAEVSSKKTHKFCHNCGKNVDGESQYCSHCGCHQNSDISTSKALDFANRSTSAKEETDSMSIVGFAVALISLVLNFAGIVGIAATVLSILGLLRCQRTGSKGKGLAIAGTAIGGVSIFYGAIVMILLL